MVTYTTCLVEHTWRMATCKSSNNKAIHIKRTRCWGLTHLAKILLVEQGVRLLRYRRAGYYHLQHLPILATLLPEILNNLNHKTTHQNQDYPVKPCHCVLSLPPWLQATKLECNKHEGDLLLVTCKGKLTRVKQQKHDTAYLRPAKATASAIPTKTMGF